jgi:hypothetical protein
MPQLTAAPRNTPDEDGEEVFWTYSIFLDRELFGVWECNVKIWSWDKKTQKGSADGVTGVLNDDSMAFTSTNKKQVSAYVNPKLINKGKPVYISTLKKGILKLIENAILPQLKRYVPDEKAMREYQKLQDLYDQWIAYDPEEDASGNASVERELTHLAQTMKDDFWLPEDTVELIQELGEFQVTYSRKRNRQFSKQVYTFTRHQ